MTEPLGGQTVVVKLRTRVKHGDYVETTGPSWPGCSVQPISSRESLDRINNAETVSSRWRIFAPAGFDARPQDVLEVDGLRLHVDGELQTWRDLEGVASHVEGLLKRWEG